MTSTCDICGAPARRHSCNGDGGNHHHGQVHTTLRGNTNDLADLCDKHYEIDARIWGMPYDSRRRALIEAGL